GQLQPIARLRAGPVDRLLEGARQRAETLLVDGHGRPLAAHRAGRAATGRRGGTLVVAPTGHEPGDESSGDRDRDHGAGPQQPRWNESLDRSFPPGGSVSLGHRLEADGRASRTLAGDPGELLFVAYLELAHAMTSVARWSSASTASSRCWGSVSSSFVCERPRRLW